LPVDREGLLNLADLEAAITDETVAVSLMWANCGKMPRSFALRLGKARNSIWERMEIPTHSARRYRWCKAWSPRSRQTIALVSNK
jgi:hypothetical protein